MTTAAHPTVQTANLGAVRVTPDRFFVFWSNGGITWDLDTIRGAQAATREDVEAEQRRRYPRAALRWEGNALFVVYVPGPWSPLDWAKNPTP